MSKQPTQEEEREFQRFQETRSLMPRAGSEQRSDDSPKSTLRQKWTAFLGGVAYLTMVSSLLGGIGVLGYQVLGWLRTAEWEPMSVMTALQWLNVRWAFQPTDWLGLYNALAFIPLAVGLPLVGFAIGIFVIA